MGNAGGVVIIFLFNSFQNGKKEYYRFISDIEWIINDDQNNISTEDCQLDLKWKKCKLCKSQKR